MARREGNMINTKVYVPGRDLEGQDRVGPNRQLTFETISNWIRLQGFDEYTEQGLIDLAARYPTSALKSFRKNFNLMIARVRAQRKQEQEPLPEPVIPIGQPVVAAPEEEENKDEFMRESYEGFDSGDTNPVSEV